MLSFSTCADASNRRLGWDCSLTLTYFLRSNEAILDFPFPDDNLLTILKGLNVDYTSVPT